MRKFFTVPTLIFFLAFGGFALWWWNTNLPAPSMDPTPYPFVIKPGASASTIAQKLEKEGFIKSSLAFRIYVQLNDKADKIRAGDYRLSKNKTLPELLGELVRGPIGVWVTLQEGLRREEMAIKIATSLDLPQEGKDQFIESFLEESRGEEGFLFPDTYLFLRNTKAPAIVEKLTATFDKRVDQTTRDQAKSQGLTIVELASLASIVERETRTNDERPIVAGILLKRLEIGMPLQADATLQYALANENCKLKIENCAWWEPIKVEDKQIKSPYNTYTNRGLPPAPIANPGLSSIKAVAMAENSQYLFYLHDNQGQIHYAKTIDEHNENIRKYLQ